VKLRHTLAAFVAALSCLAVSGTAGAQTTQNGLVNLNLDNVTVQVPIAVAANVCDVNIAVLANLVDTGANEACTAVANSTGQAVTVGAPAAGTTTQSGLVNVNLSNVTIQVPVAAAVNICDVNAAVLAAHGDIGSSSCNATARGRANH
jgi:hypothetical protein